MESAHYDREGWYEQREGVTRQNKANFQLCVERSEHKVQNHGDNRKQDVEQSEKPVIPSAPVLRTPHTSSTRSDTIQFLPPKTTIRKLSIGCKGQRRKAICPLNQAVPQSTEESSAPQAKGDSGEGGWPLGHPRGSWDNAVTTSLAADLAHSAPDQQSPDGHGLVDACGHAWASTLFEGQTWGKVSYKYTLRSSSLSRPPRFSIHERMQEWLVADRSLAPTSPTIHRRTTCSARAVQTLLELLSSSRSEWY